MSAWGVGAIVYFLLAMIAGFVFGAARELLFVPMFGRAAGEVLEVPLMLGAIIASAWLAVRWCRVPPRAPARLAMGLLSLALVLAAEVALSPVVRGSLQAWLDSFTPLALAIAALLWTAHALMPVLVRR